MLNHLQKNQINQTSQDNWLILNCVSFCRLFYKSQSYTENSCILKSYLGNDIRDIKALNEIGFEQKDYLTIEKVKAKVCAVKSKVLKLPKFSTYLEKRVYGLLSKCILASGELVSFSEIWKRITNFLKIGGKSDRNKERWAAKIKKMAGIVAEYRREGRSTKLYFRLKDEYQTRVRKPSKKPKIHPDIPSIYAKGKNNTSAGKRTNSTKVHKLAWWMSEAVGEYHYDNCKVHYQQRRIYKAFLVSLRKGVDKDILLQLYRELVMKYHQIATDKDVEFVPTGICKNIKSVSKDETAFEALQRVIKHLDCIEASIANISKQNASDGNLEDDERYCAPKGQAGGYYKTVEEFYAVQKQNEKAKMPDEKEKRQDNSIFAAYFNTACKNATF